MNKIFKTNWLILVIFLSYFVIGLALYHPVLNSFFVSDDFDWLTRAKFTPLTIGNYFLKNSNGGTEGGVYRPLTELSYLLDYKLGGLNPTFYHLSNLLFFSLTSLILFWLVFLLTKKRWLGFLSGLFFLILPNHPEAVSWISGRGDVLATFFYLLSLTLYIKFRQVSTATFLNPATKKPGNKKIFFLFILSLISFFFSVLCKEMGLTLPALIVIYEILFVSGWKKESWRGVLKRVFYLLPYALVLFLYLFLRFKTTAILAGFYANPQVKPSAVHLVRTLITIIDSNFFENYHRLGIAARVMQLYIFIPAVCLFAYFIYLILKKYRQERIALWGLALLIIGAFPALPLSFSLNTSEGERFAYLPSLGMAVILGWVSYKIVCFKRTKYLQFLPPAILIIFLAFVLVQKNYYWQEAGAISQNLLFDFGKKVDLQIKQGIVILAMPDNVYGAQVLRNGWFSALRLYYPNYTPDLLVAVPRLHITDTGRAVWLAKANGFAAKGTEKVFHGAPKIESPDYTMEITNYDKKISSGDFLEITFTKDFLAQMKQKKIIFLAPFYDEFKILELKK